MSRAEFRPCIDLHQGRVKQIVGSTLQDNGELPTTNFVSSRDPEYFSELYKRDNLTGGHVIQLGPGNREAALRALAAWPGGLQLGGGVNLSNAREFLDAGADKVIVTSFIFSEGKIWFKRLKALLALVGRAHLVLDLSCRRRDGRYYIVTDRWQKFTEVEVNAATLEQLAASSSEFLIHAVDVEGKCQGIDETLVALLAEHSPIDCVYAGGVRSFEDIRRIETIGRGRIHYTIGSALDIFGGSLPYREVVSAARRD